MPSIGWIIGGNEYTYEEAERIARSEGFFFDFPESALRALHSNRDDLGWLSPSSAGGCHRQRVLKGLYPYYRDLTGEWASGVGTATHGWLERASRNRDSVTTELRLQLQLTVALRDGTIVPYTLQGTADYYDHDRRWGIDYKTVSDFEYWHRGKREWVQRDLPTESHLIQANLYKLLFEMNDMPVDEYYLWYVRTNKDAARKVVKVDLWDNEDIYHIAAELAEPLAWYEKTGELPQNKYDSKNYICKTCPLKAVCRTLAKEGK